MYVEINKSYYPLSVLSSNISWLCLIIEDYAGWPICSRKRYCWHKTQSSVTGLGHWIITRTASCWLDYTICYVCWYDFLMGAYKAMRGKTGVCQLSNISSKTTFMKMYSTYYTRGRGEQSNIRPMPFIMAASTDFLKRWKNLMILCLLGHGAQGRYPHLRSLNLRNIW